MAPRFFSAHYGPQFPVSCGINGLDNTTYLDGNSIVPSSGSAFLAAVNDVARTLLVGESSRDFSELVPSGTNGFPGHLGTCNLLYADGHVKAVKVTTMVRETNYWMIQDEPATTPGASALVNDVDTWQLRVDKG